MQLLKLGVIGDGTSYLAIGPFLSNTDRITPLSGTVIAYTSVLLSKNGGGFAAKSDTSSATTDANGWALIPLSYTDTNSLGSLVISIQGATYCPVWNEYNIITVAMYNLMMGADYSSNLRIQMLDIQNTMGDALYAMSAQGNGIHAVGGCGGSGVYAQGGNTGNGVEAHGGSSTGDAFYGVGGPGGHGLHMVGSIYGNGALFVGSPGEYGIECLGISTGSGFYAHVTGSGTGILAIGGGSNPGIGAYAAVGQNASGISAFGYGSGNGITAECAPSATPATGSGIAAIGGVNSAGTGAGISATGQASGPGIVVLGGTVDNTPGASITSLAGTVGGTVGGPGLIVSGSSIGGHGIVASAGAAGIGHGLYALGGCSGRDLYAKEIGPSTVLDTTPNDTDGSILGNLASMAGTGFTSADDSLVAISAKEDLIISGITTIEGAVSGCITMNTPVETNPATVYTHPVGVLTTVRDVLTLVTAMVDGSYVIQRNNPSAGIETLTIKDRNGVDLTQVQVTTDTRTLIPLV